MQNNIVKPSITMLLFVLMLSCTKQKSFSDTVHPTDSGCFAEIREANSDLKKNKLVYCNYVGNIAWRMLRAEKEMDSLLAIHNIEFKNESSPCIVEENRNYHCYCDVMQETINQKFGSKFTDSLLFIADSIHTLKNLDKIYYNGSMDGDWDKCALFPGDTRYDEMNHDGLQTAFEKKVKYPAGYRYKKGEHSMAMLQVYLDIDEKGKAKITDHHIEFWDSRTKEEEYNAKYSAYFKDLAFGLIENTTWIPAKIKNINVKSRNEIIIYLK